RDRGLTPKTIAAPDPRLAVAATDQSASIQRQYGVEDRFRDIHEEAAVDLVRGVGGLVVVRVIFDAEVDEGNLRVVERAVIGLAGPILDAAGDRHRLVVTKQHG